MSISIYTPTNKIVHTARVDFVRRNIPSIIHLVQGDVTLPVIEIKMTNNNVKFDLISALNPTEINVRCMNSDFSGVSTPILGVSSDRTSLYFEVPEEMTRVYGTSLLVAEVKNGVTIVNSGPFYLEIDRNPVWEGDE